MDEFISDIHSDSAAKAFQCDLKITSEMDVSEIPTLVFFNENIEEEGIKITGYYPYEVYVQIIEEMLQEKPVRTDPPPLEIFLKHFNLVASMEIAVVYNMSVQEVERELKKLQLKQVVEKVPAKYGTFWRFISKMNKCSLALNLLLREILCNEKRPCICKVFFQLNTNKGDGRNFSRSNKGVYVCL